MKALTVKKLISLVVTALLALLILLDPLKFPDYDAQDIFYQSPRITDPAIVVIGIDEKALAEFGQYQQWSRSIMAEAINILCADPELAPEVIAIDILYTEPGADKAADGDLAEAVKNAGNVVLASNVDMGYDRENLSLQLVPVSHQKPIPELEPFVTHGLANSIIENNSVRSMPVKMNFQGEELYSFSSEIVRAYTDSPPDEYLQTHDEVYIDFTGVPGDYYQLSFADIFEEDFDPFLTAGCIVMIGPWAMGLQDSYNTPVSQGDEISGQMYGVEIHANAVQMMLEGNYKQRAADWIKPALLISLLAAAMVIGEFLDIRAVFGIFAAAGAGYMFLAKWIYGQGTVMTLLYVPVVLAVVFIYQLIYGYILEALEKARMRSTFKKYVDPKLVDKLMESGEANSDEVGKRKHIAVLFVDVRGFTPMSEALRDTPELVVHTLNEYLELTASAVFNNGGSVDKFIGDATLALFNGFVPLDDYVFKAVKAAWDIVQGAAKVNADLKTKYGVDIGFGVGVNCGEAIVGNLGPSFRKDYTAIGDTVNTASRLEANAKRSQVLITRAVYDELNGRIEAESIGEIPLKGKSIPLEVFSVTNVGEEERKES